MARRHPCQRQLGTARQQGTSRTGGVRVAIEPHGASRGFVTAVWFFPFAASLPFCRIGQLAGPLALANEIVDQTQPFWLGYANGWGFAPRFLGADRARCVGGC